MLALQSSRFLLLGLLLVLTGAVTAACSDSTETTDGGTTPDGGKTDSSTTTDSGTTTDAEPAKDSGSSDASTD